MLTEKILADAQDIRGVKKRFVFASNEIESRGTLEALFYGDLVEVSGLIRIIREPGAWRLLPTKLRVLIEITLHQSVIRQEFPVSATKGHRRAKDFLAYC